MHKFVNAISPKQIPLLDMIIEISLIPNLRVRTTDGSSTIVSPDFGDIWDTYYIKLNFNIQET